MGMCGRGKNNVKENPAEIKNAELNNTNLSQFFEISEHFHR